MTLRNTFLLKVSWRSSVRITSFEHQTSSSLSSDYHRSSSLHLHKIFMLIYNCSTKLTSRMNQGRWILQKASSSVICWSHDCGKKEIYTFQVRRMMMCIHRIMMCVLVILFVMILENDRHPAFTGMVLLADSFSTFSINHHQTTMVYLGRLIVWWQMFNLFCFLFLRVLAGMIYHWRHKRRYNWRYKRDMKPIIVWACCPVKEWFFNLQFREPSRKDRIYNRELEGTKKVPCLWDLETRESEDFIEIRHETVVLVLACQRHRMFYQTISFWRNGFQEMVYYSMPWWPRRSESGGVIICILTINSSLHLVGGDVAMSTVYGLMSYHTWNLLHESSFLPLLDAVVQSALGHDQLAALHWKPIV